ncbi:hypothetical protein BRC75_00160 [Halobacteriales archaeon QH_7_69_31]|nr:MAG: hypothetical protein BRC75_00160 [Halobacteriales archaeon QH_7_69_31]
MLFLLAAIVLSAGVAGVVAADEGPLAAAGLDQEVGVNTTVQLDGTGSSHPDGRIEGYEWSIETPDGSTMTPACRDCARTSFRPRSVGRYNVTLTVSDGDGRTDNDTLYVHVEEAGPTVELRGDTDPAVDDPTPYDASAEARDADLETLSWKLGNRTIAREPMAGQTDWTTRSFSFTEADTYRLVVIARDASNRTARDTLTVKPQDSPTAATNDTEANNGTTTPSSNLSTTANDTDTNHGCENAAVVKNPTGTGPAAAAYCIDSNSGSKQYADEKCSGDITDCKYAEPDGISSPASESGGDGVGDGFSGMKSTHLGGDISYNTGRSSPSAESSDAFAGTTGNKGII